MPQEVLPAIQQKAKDKTKHPFIEGISRPQNPGEIFPGGLRRLR